MTEADFRAWDSVAQACYEAAPIVVLCPRRVALWQELSLAQQSAWSRHARAAVKAWAASELELP